MSDALKVRGQDTRRLFKKFQAKRTVFNCLVVGATGSGKSAFLDAFLGNFKEEIKDPLNPDISFRGTHFPQ